MKQDLTWEPIKKAHIFLFSKKDSTINLLLYKTSSKYDIISTELNRYDNACTFALARILTTEFEKLFSKEIIDKIISNTPLTEEDVKKPEPYMQYKLWENPVYKHWLNELSSDKIIQYDDIKGEVTFFYEIPYLNLDSLNENLKKLNYFSQFTYINTDNSIDSIKDSLSESALKYFNTISLSTIKNHILHSLKELSNPNNPIYIILACKTAGKDQEGFFHFPALLKGLYKKNLENWKYLVTSVDPLPTEEELEKVKAILIPGSNLNVYNDIDFLRKTESFLKKLLDDIYFNNKYPNLKILGICFGMQIIVKALGGEVIKGTMIERFPVKMNLDEAFWNFKYVKDSQVDKREYLKICEAHGDYVTKLPDEKYKFKKYGSSTNCEYECICDEKGQVFMVQGHPEYHPDFSCMRGAAFFLSFRKIEPTEENIKKFLEENEKAEANQNVNVVELRKICYSFMKG